MDSRSETSLKILAIIPARGGSKGIPGKNIRFIAGKPLLAHTILHAQQTPLIHRVVVSTDDPHIAQTAREYGAEVIDRPTEISGDTATSESALVHVLDTLEQRESYIPDIVVFLQATSPSRRRNDISNALDLFLSENADSLLSVSEIHGFVWRSSKTLLEPVNYNPITRPRRQELVEDMLDENGSIYIFKPWVLRNYNSRLGGKIIAYRMNPLDSLQIDDPGDFELLEKVIRILDSSHDEVSALKDVRLLVLDFDGVMTDNRVLVSEDGKESVNCNRSDGWGIIKLVKAGIPVEVISTEENPVVTTRCRKLGIACIQGCHDKLEVLKRRACEHGIPQKSISYAGNDENDLDCMRWAGYPVAVADAHPSVLAVARLITRNRGGHGAVREIVDQILKAKGYPGTPHP